MALHKVGDPVRQILPAPQQGVVKAMKFDETTGTISVVFDVPDGNGGTMETVFKEHEVEAVPAEAAPE